jgi:hypothetical protein
MIMDYLDFLFISIGILILFYQLRRNHIKSKQLEYKYKFYKLRDRLRMLALEGKVNPNDWAFQYLDSSICRTVANLKDISFFSAIYYSKQHKDDEARQSFRSNLAGSLNKNKELAKIHQEYGALIMMYIIKSLNNP